MFSRYIFQLQRITAFGRAIDQVVDRAQHLAEALVEAGAGIAELDEDEVAVDRDVARRAHAGGRFGGREPRALVRILQRHAERRAVEPIRPRVVRAAEQAPGVAALVADEPGALVGTAVVEHAHRAVGLAHHHQRAAGDLDGDVVAGFRHLARVADIVPRRGEEAALLERVHLGAQVHVAVHAVVFDQREDCATLGGRRLQSFHAE
jgi:hypothetical protein